VGVHQGMQSMQSMQSLLSGPLGLLAFVPFLSEAPQTPSWPGKSNFCGIDRDNCPCWGGTRLTGLGNLTFTRLSLQMCHSVALLYRRQSPVGSQLGPTFSWYSRFAKNLYTASFLLYKNGQCVWPSLFTIKYEKQQRS